MTTGEIQQNPEQHRSAVEVAKSYVDRNAEKYNTQQTDQGPGVRNYEVLRTRDGKHGIDVNNNRIEDAAKKEKVEVKIGEHPSFTEAASQAMYGKTYENLSHPQRNVILNMYLILASQGFEMNSVRSTDQWDFDFKNKKITFHLNGSTTFYRDLEYIGDKEKRQEVIRKTSTDLAGLKNRLTAEAQNALNELQRSGEKTSNVRGALRTRSIQYVLATLNNDSTSFKSRKTWIEQRAKDFKEGAGKAATGMANEIAGINSHLEKAGVKGQFINPDTGEGYKGTVEQNNAWIKFIEDVLAPRTVEHEYLKDDWVDPTKRGEAKPEAEPKPKPEPKPKAEPPAPAPATPAEPQPEAVPAPPENLPQTETEFREQLYLHMKDALYNYFAELITPGKTPPNQPLVRIAAVLPLKATKFPTEFRMIVESETHPEIREETKVSLPSFPETLAKINEKFPAKQGGHLNRPINEISPMLDLDREESEVASFQEAVSAVRRRVEKLEGPSVRILAGVKFEREGSSTSRYKALTEKGEYTLFTKGIKEEERLLTKPGEKGYDLRFYPKESPSSGQDLGHFATLKEVEAAIKKNEKISKKAEAQEKAPLTPLPDRINRKLIELGGNPDKYDKEFKSHGLLFSSGQLEYADVKIIGLTQSHTDKKTNVKYFVAINDKGNYRLIISVPGQTIAEVKDYTDATSIFHRIFEHKQEMQRAEKPTEKPNETLGEGAKKTISVLGGNPENFKDPLTLKELKEYNIQFIKENKGKLVYEGTSVNGYKFKLLIDNNGLTLEMPYTTIKSIDDPTIRVEQEPFQLGTVYDGTVEQLKAKITSNDYGLRKGLIDPETLKPQDREKLEKKNAKEMDQRLKNLGLDPENYKKEFAFAGEKFIYGVGEKEGQPFIAYHLDLPAPLYFELQIVNPGAAGNDPKAAPYKIFFLSPNGSGVPGKIAKEFNNTKDLEKAISGARALQKPHEIVLRENIRKSESPIMEPQLADALDALGGSSEAYKQDLQISGIPAGLVFKFREFSWKGGDVPPEKIPEGRPMPTTVDAVRYLGIKDSVYFNLKIVDPSTTHENSQDGKQEKCYKLTINSGVDAPAGLRIGETIETEFAAEIKEKIKETIQKIEAAKVPDVIGNAIAGAGALAGESAPPLSDDSDEAEALKRALEEEPLSPTLTQILREVLRLDNYQIPFKFGGFEFKYYGAMGESEVFYVGDKTAPELKLNIKLDKKKGTASIMLGGNKISGRPKPFQSASALEKFLETLSK